MHAVVGNVKSIDVFLSLGKHMHACEKFNKRCVDADLRVLRMQCVKLLSYSASYNKALS